MRVPVIREILMLCATIFTIGCSGEAALPEVVGRDSSGVRIVEGPSADAALPWTLTEIRRLGGADSGPASFTEANAWTVGTDRNGRIYVLDRIGFQVAVFDSSGNVIRTMGTKGGGPGELQFPGTLIIRPDGETNVFDFGKQSLVRFSPDGAIVPQFSLQPYGFPAGQLKLTGDTLIMVTPSGGGENDRFRVQNLKIVSPRDSLTIARDSVPTPGMTMFSCVGMNIPPPFASDLVWGTDGRVVAVTHRVPYEIDVFREGRLVSSVRRRLARVTATTEHVGRLYPEGMTVQFGGGQKCTIKAEEIIEKLGAGGDVPFVKALTFGPDGSLWVERYTFQDEDPRLDVFAADGRYLGTLTGHSLPMGFIGDDIVLFPIEDEDTGGKLVGLYRIGRS
jgi:hypothetical protein